MHHKALIHKNEKMRKLYKPYLRFLSNAFFGILLHDGNIIESIYFIFPDYKLLLLIHNTIVAILISNVS